MVLLYEFLLSEKLRYVVRVEGGFTRVMATFELAVVIGVFLVADICPRGFKKRFGGQLAAICSQKNDIAEAEGRRGVNHVALVLLVFIPICLRGNRYVNTALLDQRWDLIFFTGSPALAKTVMTAAAKNLTPVVLELGGKSPCIIDKTADIKVAAKRIAWGKTLNSGQTCIAPDYILIHEDIKETFVKAFAEEVGNLHGEDIKADTHYVRMVNDKAFERVTGYFKDGKIIYGGRTDAATRFIEPTLIEDVALDSPLMTEEIFGPVFPIVTMNDSGKTFRNKVIDFVTSREKPLAFYYFGKESDGWDIIRRTSSGGGCINDVIMHIANENVPFGGVGNSGMGRYHDKDSFEAFSHTRSIIATGNWIDLPFRYMPYRMFGLVKKIL